MISTKSSKIIIGSPRRRKARAIPFTTLNETSVGGSFKWC